MDDECIHGLGPIAGCVICNGRAAREEADARRVDMTMPAKYKSLLNCGHFPEVGDPILRLGDGRWVCEDCVP